MLCSSAMASFTSSCLMSAILWLSSSSSYIHMYTQSLTYSTLQQYMMYYNTQCIIMCGCTLTWLFSFSEIWLRNWLLWSRRRDTSVCSRANSVCNSFTCASKSRFIPTAYDYKHSVVNMLLHCLIANTVNTCITLLWEFVWSQCCAWFWKLSTVYG